MYSLKSSSRTVKCVTFGIPLFLYFVYFVVVVYAFPHTTFTSASRSPNFP